MNIPKELRKRLAGFTLVELAIALLIIGILMSAGLSLATVRRAAAQREATQTNEQTIKQALINYLAKYKRLPCPPTSFANAGIASPPPPCANVSGVVPYFELGLDRSVALDGWENYITYVISPNPVAPLIPPAPNTTAWTYAYSPTTNTPPLTTTGALAFWPSTSTGGIIVKGEAGAVIATPTNNTGAAVALISYGQNGYGAFNLKGGPNVNGLPPTVNTDEVINMSIGLPAAQAQPTVVKRDATDSTLIAGGPFDDIVTIISANDLTGSLISNGALQNSPLAALSQANDFVIGTILSSKTACPGVALVPVCSTANYYYVIPGAIPSASFPATVTAWGITYSIGNTTFIDVSKTNAGATIAYTLTAGDGTQKTVAPAELMGNLLHAGNN